MRRFIVACLLAGWLLPVSTASAAEALPFHHKVEVYRNKAGDTVFTLRLEQPFLADEFEKSNYLRLQAADDKAYLIYPKETKFRQKHAEFYGRLRGEGRATLTLSYEIISENLDGTRRVQEKRSSVPVPIPTKETGPKSIFLDWARQQNTYFAKLLRYYPKETFFQYCLLQSRARYGVTPPNLPELAPDRAALETSLYQVFSASLAIQESLQYDTLSTRSPVGRRTTHVSTLRPPDLRSLPYEKLLEEKRTKEKIEPTVHEVARLVPADQYLLHFNSMASLNELLDFSAQWGNSLLRLFSVRAQDERLRAKLEDQLCVRSGPLARLFADQVVSEVAITGADLFVLEGTDVTLILRLTRPAVFERAARGWLDAVRKRHPAMVDRQFNYRGHKVEAHYTKDRAVSSFVVRHDDYAVFSNSHRAVRRVIEAAAGVTPSLHGALDYRYVTTILPPSKDPRSGYFFASEAFIKRQLGPAAKISEKRRLQCYSNLVMLNNASLMFRLEYGHSPKSLSELVEGRFVDPERIVCPHGGAYAFDVQNDACTCSVHNRLKYLAPNVELSVLKVSAEEASQYNRYKQRYRAFWGQLFDPIAIRLTVGPRIRLETCVVPLANGSLYRDLRAMVDKAPRDVGTARFAPSAAASFVTVPGREKIAAFLRGVPGLAEALEADPTLTDLAWLGDRVSLHLCDGETILEIDPTRFRTLDLPLINQVSVVNQALASTALLAAKMPVYVTVDVESRDKATRLLEQLASRLFLKREKLVELPTALDAYRLPDYKGHALYVFSGQLYAIKLRLHVALVGDQLVAATKPRILRQAIDASTAKPTRPPVKAHMLLRFRRKALDRLRGDLELYWAEKSRLACHRNISSIYNLHKLYGTPIADVPRLSEAKYGVTHFCPDGGAYAFDAARNQVVCNVHGNRERSRQHPRPNQQAAFVRFIDRVDEIVATLRFRDEALIATLEIHRNPAAPK